MLDLFAYISVLETNVHLHSENLALYLHEKYCKRSMGVLNFSTRGGYVCIVTSEH